MKEEKKKKNPKQIWNIARNLFYSLKLWWRELFGIGMI